MIFSSFYVFNAQPKFFLYVNFFFDWMHLQNKSSLLPQKQNYTFLFLFQLQAQYLHKYAALATSFSLHHTPKIQLSASAGTSSLAFGIQTKYEIASRQFREIDAGFSMTKPNYDASITM